jgi:hypothetical protein
VPSVIATIVAVKATHAAANDDMMPNSRRSTGAAGLAGAGFGGIATFGGAGGAAVAVAAPAATAVEGGGLLVGSDMAVRHEVNGPADIVRIVRRGRVGEFVKTYTKLVVERRGGKSTIRRRGEPVGANRGFLRQTSDDSSLDRYEGNIRPVRSRVTNGTPSAIGSDGFDPSELAHGKGTRYGNQLLFGESRTRWRVTCFAAGPPCDVERLQFGMFCE